MPSCAVKKCKNRYDRAKKEHGVTYHKRIYIVMARYFEEMGWRPLEEGEQPNHLLHIARFLIDYGAHDENMQWPRLPPPASTKSIEQLTSLTVDEENSQCPICLKNHAVGDTVKQMPCSHTFHPNCILTWLSKTNSCPLCRFELPTDNERYEAFKKEKKRAEQRKEDIDTLHNSMFS